MGGTGRRGPVILRQGSPAHRLAVAIPWVLVLGAIAYVPFAADVGFAPASLDQPFRIEQLNEVVAFAVAILGLNVVVGCSGQLSLGQSAFVGLGAYTTVILVADHGWSILATLPVAALVGLAAGLVVGVPASRMRGPYLAVATLALAYVFPALVLKYESLTGGVDGKGPPRGALEMVPPAWAPFADAGRLAEPLWVYCILVTVAAVLFVLARNLVRSRPGRALIAARDHAASARSCGIDPARSRAMAFALSAAYGAVAGAMLMINRPFATDGQFGTRVALFLLVGAVIGGTGSLAGAVPGAFAYVFVPSLLTEWTDDPSGMPPGLRHAATPLFEWLRPAGATMAGFFFGLTLLALVFLLPGGLVDGVRRVRDRVVRIVPQPMGLAEGIAPGARHDGVAAPSRTA